MNTNASVVAPQTTVVKILPNDKGNPPGKLADAELHFVDGALAGLKLIGFAIWERRTGTGRNVTFPARQYSVNGERRSFALLRPVSRHQRPGRHPRPDPRRLRGVRARGVTDHQLPERLRALRSSLRRFRNVETAGRATDRDEVAHPLSCHATPRFELSNSRRTNGERHASL